MLTLVLAAAPSVFLLTFFYLKDRYEREPLRHILMAFGLGLYAMLAAEGMANTAEAWLPVGFLRTGGEPARLVDAFLLSGFIEEFAKGVVLMAAIYHWQEFDEPLDGVVYGVAVALGFATLENFFFVARLGIGVAWQRALFAVPAHALFGATMGYYAGRTKFDHGGKLRVDGVLLLAAPTGCHGLYDYALHHGLGWRIWVVISLLSVGLWAFVLRRVHRAQARSPFRPDAPG
jgi:RsiW-degrading membrane proteinase PrsW (M82 family)